MSNVDNDWTSPHTSTILNRPHFAPAGPRTRQSSFRTSTLPIDAPASATLPQETLPLGTMGSSATLKPLPAHPKPLPTISLPYQSTASTVNPSDPLDADDGSNQLVVSGATSLPTSRPSSLTSSAPSTQSKYLPCVNEEEPTSPAAAPAYHYDNRTQSDVETASRASHASEPSSIPAKVTLVPQPLPKLTPPPPIAFESVPVPWKGMPLEPALWTFNSTELQAIVSRAIRLSAKESFIRLLTIENLDRVLPAELERLNQLKTSTQARYRFLVQRRKMLFHALNASSIGPKKEQESELLVSELTAQLVETTADCDQRLEELFRINDQITQVDKLLDVHSSSALAVALRKLNSSYARRTRDLNKARQRIFQLEAEIEDAWKEAEKLANELDEYEAGTDDAVIETAEIVPVPRSPSQSPPPILTNIDRRGSLPMPMTPTLLTVKSISRFSPTYTSPRSHHSSSASPVMHFVFPPPVSKDLPNNDDAVSIKSSKSIRSFKSTKSAKGYASSLHAAKKRSSRASHSSLRLSIGSSSHHARGPSGDVPPPMPEIPLHFVSAVYGTGAKSGGQPGSQTEVMSNESSTAMHYVTSSHLTRNSTGSFQFRRVKKQASLDTLPANKKRGSVVIDAYRGKAADDIYVRTGDSSHGHRSALQSSRTPYSGGNAYVNLSWDDDSEIQAVPRTPPYRARTISNPMVDFRTSHRVKGGDVPPLPPPKDPSRTLPSAWRNSISLKHKNSRVKLPATSDMPLPLLPKLGGLPHSVPSQNTAGGRSSSDKPGLLRRSKTLVMIKGFTKRYSASIPPIFNGKPSLKNLKSG